MLQPKLLPELTEWSNSRIDDIVKMTNTRLYLADDPCDGATINTRNVMILIVFQILEEINISFDICHKITFEEACALVKALDERMHKEVPQGHWKLTMFTIR